MSARREEEEETVQADMLPVMNVMFLLIPALLLAMEFASMAQIPIQTPKFTGLPSTTPPTAPKQQLEFKVIIGSDGFETVASGSKGARIPLAGAGHDFAALTKVARDLKAGFPEEGTVTISAEGDIPMHVLVRTIDALRGESCRLAGYAQGEKPDASCLFWSPVIESVG